MTMFIGRLYLPLLIIMITSIVWIVFLLKNRNKIKKYRRVIYTGLLIGIVFSAYYGASGGTDEDEYQPYFFKYLSEGKNPYTTQENPWGYPYVWLPMIGFLQIPIVPYIFTVLVFTAILALLLSEYRFLLFFNPLTIWAIMGGFNDIVPISLFMIGILYRKKIAIWLAAASKQFILPIMTPIFLWQKKYKLLLTTIIFTSLVCLPFIIWNSSAFFENTIFIHFNKLNDMGQGYVFPNYFMYISMLVALYPNKFIRLGKRIKEIIR